MRTVRTTFAAILAVLAFAAFESSADAQARRGESGSSSGTSRSTSVTRTRPSSSKPSGTITNKSQERPAPGQPSRPSVKPSDRPVPGQPSRPSVKPSDRPAPGQSSRPSVRPDAGRGSRPVRPEAPVQARPDRKPAPQKLHPHSRDFITYDRPSHFWARNNHFYGHRVKMLPSFVTRHVYRGITYYCHNNIWYRPFGGYYVVCRPPFGTVLAANLVAGMVWAAVRFPDRYHATPAYTLAGSLGLSQSHPSGGNTYYYQDGVFYTLGSDGNYVVIVPPAGALVETLPDDAETIILDGNEYYKVDDTVYRVTVSEGRAYFEVLGQL